VKWYDANRYKYPPLLLAAVIHNQFENIHPFQDGNGRVGRLLLNNILLKHSLPPVDIEFRNRAEYYRSLQVYEKDGNIRPTIELLLKEYRRLRSKLR
jgi:Fic family protein